MIDFLAYTTFAWLTFWAIFAIRRLAAGSRDSILFVMIVFYVFFGVPLFMDMVFGKPYYTKQPGFFLAANDDATSILYCLYISAIPLLWWWTGRTNERKMKVTYGSSYRRANFESLQTLGLISQRLSPILYMGLLSPLVALVFAPAPEIYLTYGAAIGEALVREVADYHSVVAMTSLLSLLSVGGLLLSRRKIHFTYIMFLFPWIIFSCWVSGKRYIVAITIVILVYAFWQKGYLQGRRLVSVGLFAVILFGAFSYGYQNILRYEGSVDNTEVAYENLRVDYGRDGVTKMAIFAELNPDVIRILEYRGQSFLYYITMYIPREKWEEKPWTYPTYVTSAMLMIPPQSLGWGVTTSIVEEAIANLSWWGMIVGPLIISLFCRIGDGQRETLMSAVTVLVASLLLVVQLGAFMPLLFIWLILVFWLHLSRGKPGQTRDITKVHRLFATHLPLLERRK